MKGKFCGYSQALLGPEERRNAVQAGKYRSQRAQQECGLFEETGGGVFSRRNPRVPVAKPEAAF